MKNKTSVNILGMILAGVLASGCTATLQHGKIYTSPMADKGPMGVNQHAENVKEHIGWGTLTIFAIPVCPVTLSGNPDSDLMNQIRDAVEHAGYKVQMVDSANAAGTLPVLSCKVDKFKFRNYTWLFPIVFNWGTIQLHVTITAPDGHVMWDKTYTGKANGMYDFNPTVNSALDNILNELSSDLANAQFTTTTGGASEKSSK